MSQYIFITGGVSSSLGKGLAASSLGYLLEDWGLKVGLQKMDPYINIDAGTMSPYQHGEVYVTRDGKETDLDLGNYERFTGLEVSGANSVTAGQIYKEVIEKERRGEYLGETVQMIPHITNEIKGKIRGLSQRGGFDVLIVEIGGTVGDIESIPFLESIRQFKKEEGEENCIYVHLTLVPLMGLKSELKTKPTQHSVKELRMLGIKPDILLCRTSRRMTREMKRKLSLFCDVELESVMEALDIERTVYEIPILYREQKLDEIIMKKLRGTGMSGRRSGDLKEWKAMLEVVRRKKKEVEIGLIGKYIELKDAYASVHEAIYHGGIWNEVDVKVRPISSEDLEKYEAKEYLRGLQGLIIPGGFGERGIEGKIKACEYARGEGLVSLGLCLGLQCMVIEFARNQCGLVGANSAEFDEVAMHKVIDIWEEGKGIKLGVYKVELMEGSLARRIYGVGEVYERHRHRYEVKKEYRASYEEEGLKVTGWNEGVIEIMEFEKHKWYMGCQFHPEFESKPLSVHPLFRDFIRASMECG